jgi:transcriptional regulator with XRE-family HTH domain
MFKFKESIELGEMLWFMRRKKRESRQEIAALLCLSKSWYNKIESGEARVTIAQLNALLEHFGATDEQRSKAIALCEYTHTRYHMTINVNARTKALISRKLSNRIMQLSDEKLAEILNLLQ